MGIYDRDYYRHEGPSYLDALIPSGLVCKWLIGINVIVYIMQLMTTGDRTALLLGGGESGPVTSWLLLDTDRVLHGELWRLLTYAFVHSEGSVYHILFNMLFLWWFGSDLESMYGPREFTAFYLCSAFFGGLAYQVWDVAQGNYTQCLGASGAVTALLVLCAFHFPTRVIRVFFFLPVPIWLFALFNIAQDAFAFFGYRQTGVAVVVHLAGALFAAAYFKFQFHLSDVPAAWLGGWKKRRPAAKARLKLYRPENEAQAAAEPVAVPATKAPKRDVDEHLEARLDAVLEKLARSGKESLTEGEREILVKASEIYKRRRT